MDKRKIDLSFVHLSILYLSIYLSSIYLSIYLSSICLSIYLYFYLSINLIPGEREEGAEEGGRRQREDSEGAPASAGMDIYSGHPSPPPLPLKKEKVKQGRIQGKILGERKKEEKGEEE